MIGLAAFDRSLTLYRNNSNDIAGTARSRLISGVEMQRIFLFFEVAGCDIDDRFLLVCICGGISPTQARQSHVFRNRFFSEILGSRSIRQLTSWQQPPVSATRK
jgi:hypothetical protein